ncbi:MAG: hypothetical protein LBI29_02370 [Rickettsiales bacterium]|nr:hypothetical protein [Rickettsiales bacterium]
MNPKDLEEDDAGWKDIKNRSIVKKFYELNSEYYKNEDAIDAILGVKGEKDEYRKLIEAGEAYGEELCKNRNEQDPDKLKKLSMVFREARNEVKWLKAEENARILELAMKIKTELGDGGIEIQKGQTKINTPPEGIVAQEAMLKLEEAKNRAQKAENWVLEIKNKVQRKYIEWQEAENEWQVADMKVKNKMLEIKKLEELEKFTLSNKKQDRKQKEDLEKKKNEIKREVEDLREIERPYATNKYNWQEVTDEMLEAKKVADEMVEIAGYRVKEILEFNEVKKKIDEKPGPSNNMSNVDVNIEELNYENYELRKKYRDIRNHLGERDGAEWDNIENRQEVERYYELRSKYYKNLDIININRGLKESEKGKRYRELFEAEKAYRKEFFKDKDKQNSHELEKCLEVLNRKRNDEKQYEAENRFVRDVMGELRKSTRPGDMIKKRRGRVAIIPAEEGEARMALQEQIEIEKEVQQLRKANKGTEENKLLKKKEEELEKAQKKQMRCEKKRIENRREQIKR